MQLRFQQYAPVLERGVWLAPTAVVVGDVRLGRDASIWFGTVVRGDVHAISIGERTNIQDNSVVHVTHHKSSVRSPEDGHPTVIGADVTIGHRAVIHGCTIRDCCLIGMGAVLLDGVELGEESIVGAGSVVTPGKRFPARSLIVGAPARLVRTISDAEAERIGDSAKRYVEFQRQYAAMDIGQSP